MGQKATQPKLYVSFSLDDAVPANHLVRKIEGCVDFSFVRDLARRFYSRTGQPSVDPVVLFKLSLLGYLFNITSERRLCEEAGLNPGLALVSRLRTGRTDSRSQRFEQGAFGGSAGQSMRRAGAKSQRGPYSRGRSVILT